MGEKVDPYREASVRETATVWPDDLADLSAEDRQRIAERLHGSPEVASELEYVRLHTGFCRKITVTAEDIERLK